MSSKVSFVSVILSLARRVLLLGMAEVPMKRGWFQGLESFKQGHGLKAFAAHLYPNFLSVPLVPRVSDSGNKQTEWNFNLFDSSWHATKEVNCKLTHLQRKTKAI